MLKINNCNKTLLIFIQPLSSWAVDHPRCIKEGKKKKKELDYQNKLQQNIEQLTTHVAT